jgi:hypothetical protein
VTGSARRSCRVERRPGAAGRANWVIRCRSPAETEDRDKAACPDRTRNIHEVCAEIFAELPGSIKVMARSSLCLVRRGSEARSISLGSKGQFQLEISAPAPAGCDRLGLKLVTFGRGMRVAADIADDLATAVDGTVFKASRSRGGVRRSVFERNE